MQLHRSDVVEKAAHILDEYGIADLTMRRLARELSVTPGALYWHFADKQELLGAVADRILEPAVRDVAAMPWTQQISTIGAALREALLSSTDGAELVSATFAAGKSAVLARVLGLLAAAGAEAGLESTNADLAARTVVYYVLGFVVDEQSRLQWDAAGARLDGQSLLTSNPNRRFTFGMRLLVDGISAQCAASSDERVSPDEGVETGVTVPTT